MTRVTLVRHGQAQTGAIDEASYDRLSPLGRQQAAWLGDYLAVTSSGVSRVVSGPMRRQQQTATEIAQALSLKVERDTRLVEINYFALAASLERRRSIGLPTDRRGFLAHLPQVMAAWHDGAIENPDETFDNFQARVLGALDEAEAKDGTLLVTSGGVIGMAIRHVLSLELDAFSHVLLQTNNASLHRYEVEFDQRRLVTFNAIPHLDIPGREHARTYV